MHKNDWHFFFSGVEEETYTETPEFIQDKQRIVLPKTDCEKSQSLQLLSS